MYLQENRLFDLDLRFKVTGNVAQCPLHHMTFAPTDFEVTTSKGLGGEVFTRKFNIWPLTWTLGSRSHKMLPSTLYIMWPIQLQGLRLPRPTVKEEIHLQENTLCNPWPWGKGHTKWCSVLSTLSSLLTCKVWESLLPPTIKEMHLQVQSNFVGSNSSVRVRLIHVFERYLSWPFSSWFMCTLCHHGHHVFYRPKLQSARDTCHWSKTLCTLELKC